MRSEDEFSDIGEFIYVLTYLLYIDIKFWIFIKLKELKVEILTSYWFIFLYFFGILSSLGFKSGF